jgi:hypothetical protein
MISDPSDEMIVALFPRPEIVSRSSLNSYWEARGCQGGSAEEDWLRAERNWETRSGRSKRDDHWFAVGKVEHRNGLGR